MKAVVFHGIGDIRLDDVEEPRIEKPTDAIVRLSASAICGTDLHMIRGTLPGMKPGTILGHEGVGYIEELGEDVRNFSVGDRVVIPSTIACGSCVYCRSGYYAQCNEANPHGRDAFASKVREQAEIMRDQVARHLERARLAARLTVVGSVTEVEPVVTALARTMEKIHRDRSVAIAVEAEAQAKFRGERPDLEEMIGNLVDNACKWATSEVSVKVTREAGEAGPVLRIVVDDDGRGLSAEERERVAKRGQRLDETKPGSGLGLSIVVELARLYGGSLTLGEAPAGGLRAELVLPAG